MELKFAGVKKKGVKEIEGAGGWFDFGVPLDFWIRLVQ